jgi:hypothetical protein
MKEAGVVEKVLVFRRDHTEPVSNLLREVADYLDAKPDVEEMVSTIAVDYYVGEPTVESAPACFQEREARVYVTLPKIFDDVTIKEVRE